MFKSFRSRLIFSYVAIVVLVLTVALTGTLLLAKFYSERTDFRTLEQKSALVLPFVQLELTNPRRPMPQQLLDRMRESVRISQVRILFVNPETMNIEQDTSMRFDSIGERFVVDDLDPNFSGLSAQRGVQGKFSLPGENVTFLYTAYRIRGLVQATGATGPARDAAPARQAGNVIVVFAQPERGVRDLARELVDYFGLAALLALLLAVAAAFWLGRSISRPVARLTEGTRAIARGDYNQQLPVEGRDELSSLTQHFNEMSAEVNRAHRMERDFVANVSHDLKTPLTSIQGFSQAMLDGAIVEVAGYRQAASIINTEAQRMSRLVNELLSLSKLQNQLSTLNRKPVNLNTLVSQLVLAMQPQAQAAAVGLTCELELSDVWVLADEDRLNQAFSNLIDNAIKYTLPGGMVRLTAYFTEAGTVSVSVRDTGQGIPEADLPRVMERFYQVDKSRSYADGRSAGLGLAITREIVRAHGGELVLTSLEGMGTEVTVKLPLPAFHIDPPGPASMLEHFGHGARRSLQPSEHQRGMGMGDGGGN